MMPPQVRLLVEEGNATVDALDLASRTALDWAREREFWDIVTYLVCSHHPCVQSVLGFITPHSHLLQP